MNRVLEFRRIRYFGLFLVICTVRKISLSIPSHDAQGLWYQIQQPRCIIQPKSIQTTDSTLAQTTHIFYRRPLCWGRTWMSFFSSSFHLHLEYLEEVSMMPVTLHPYVMSIALAVPVAVLRQPLSKITLNSFHFGKKTVIMLISKRKRPDSAKFLNNLWQEDAFSTTTSSVPDARKETGIQNLLLPELS